MVAAGMGYINLVSVTGEPRLNFLSNVFMDLPAVIPFQQALNSISWPSLI
jgi:hypothetical protein